jgi:CRISPR-associated protein Cmr3
LGKLQFSGPFLLKCGEALWPLPSHILGKHDKGGPWKPNALLRPSASLLETDRGWLNLPEIATVAGENGGLKSGSGSWITTAGLGEVLAGKPPSASAVVAPGELWRTEARVGFRRDEQTLQIGEGDLYSPSYIRLARNTALGLGLEGLPAEMAGPPGLFPLGGESRLARCESLTTAPLPKAPSPDRFAPNPDGRVEFTIILLTPGRFQNLEQELPGARVVSACFGKPAYLGGWDSLANEPLPLEPFHPAGSVWFCDAPVEGFRTGALIQHGRWIGEHSRHGYGQIVIGRWPAPSNSDSDHKP